MSGCGCPTPSRGPCNRTNPEESVASTLDNLTLNLFGEVIKSIINGRATWTFPTLTSSEAAGFPRHEGEGYLEYVLRLIGIFGISWLGEWNSGTTYLERSIVRIGPTGNTLYIALTDNTNKLPSSNPSDWEVFVVAPSGPQGDPGPPGSSSSPVLSIATITADTTATDLHECIVIDTSSGPVTLTLSLISSYLTGKRFNIVRLGSNNATISVTSPNTILGGSTFVLDTDGAGVLIAPIAATKWGIL